MTYDYALFLQTVAYDKIVDLSATTVALSLSAISDMLYREKWDDNGEKLTDLQWDELEKIIALANGELMSTLVGMIFPHVMGTVSIFKMLPCDGATHNKADYPLLYDAIDSQYIVSGSQFRVPDLRDRVPVGTGNLYNLDDTGGSNSVVLSVAQLPSHRHTYNQYSFGIDIESVGVPDPTGVGQPALGQNTSAVGSGESHENRQPYVAVNYAIVAG